MALESGGPWLDAARRPRSEPLSQDTDADLVVVGGGITGATTALLARREGMDVVLLERGTVASGTTGNTTGKVTAQHGLLMARLIDRHGVGQAQQYADANRAGIDLVRSLADELGASCDLTTADAVAFTGDPTRVAEIEKEVNASQRLGLSAVLVGSWELPMPLAAGVSFRDQVHLHPVKYVDALVDAFVAAGGRLHEGTTATSVEEDDDIVRVTTAHGVVRARHAVVATLLPPGVIGGYFARTRPEASHGLALELTGEASPLMTISVDRPTHSTRPWPSHGPKGLLVIGNGHPVGTDDAGRRAAELEEWARDTFPVASVLHRWTAHDYVTPDLVPYVGRALMSEQVLVATGFAKWGLASGTAAGVMLVDAMVGRPNPWQPVFEAARLDGLRSVPPIVRDNLAVAAELLGGLRREVPRCTHLGCPLHWNDAASTWDCRCHGSRFTAEGEVLAGPATRPLDLKGVGAAAGQGRAAEAE